MLFEFFLVFVCNRFYGWLVMWIAAFSRMGTYLNFTHETCFSHQLSHKPGVEFVFLSNTPFTISICTFHHYLVWQLIAEIICTSSNIWALAFPTPWFHTLVTVLGHSTDCSTGHDQMSGFYQNPTEQYYGIRVIFPLLLQMIVFA